MGSEHTAPAGSWLAVPGSGAWIAVVGGSGLAVLPGETPDAVVAQVATALAASGANLESTVSSIPLRGEQAVGSFAVAHLIAPQQAGRPEGGWWFGCVARGSAALDLVSAGGSRRFGSSGIEPWALAEFGDVIGLSAGELPPVPEAPLRLPADGAPITVGPARADHVYWVAGAPAASETPAAPGTRIEFDDGADPDATIVRAPIAVTTAAGPEAAGPKETGAAGADSPPAPDPPVTFTLRLGDASAVPLDGAVVVGRDPRLRRHPTALPQALLRVPSPEQKVSSTHLEIARTGRTVVITDLRSTNGTIVTADDRAPVRLRHGDSVVASRSAIVEIGDGNVIHILAPERGISGITV